MPTDLLRTAILALLAALTASAQPQVGVSQPAVPAPQLAPDAGPTAYVGGLWYDGDKFVARDTVWAERGVFVPGPLADARVVDLGGTFVVPPFGDAHYHGLDDPAGLARGDSTFVAEGIVYVLNPNGLRSNRDQVRGMETVIDIAYANGGITAPGAHPVSAYERQALGLTIQQMYDRADEVRESRLRDGDAYHLALTPDDLDAVWPRVLDGHPDVVKVYLRFSEEWAEGAPEHPRGLSPAVVAEVVRRAHAAGLRVVAHVETAADARNALDSGVDVLAHAPAPNAIQDSDTLLAGAQAYVMDDALLASLAVRGIPVTPTLAYTLATLKYVPQQYHPSAEVQAVARRFHRDVYRRLAEAGVPIAFGADAAGSLSSRDEAAYAVEVGGLTPAQALRAWAVDTPRAIVPDRAVGRLADGFEASLLALACDPVQDWSCTGQITHREKQGADLGASPSDLDARTPCANPDAPTTAYVGGLWYEPAPARAEGARFVARDTTWSADGVFVAARPARVDTTVALGARYVVPPFADAHQHDIEGPWSLPAVQAHLDAGDFYVKVVNNAARYPPMIAGEISQPSKLDVTFSHASVTAPGAHPIPLYRRLVERGIYWDLDPDSLDGVFAFGVGSVADFERRWPDVLAQRSDHLKLLLLDHQRGTGLQPDVFRRAVALARAAGLRTTVHVLTAADLALAVDAGADEAAHLPGFAHRREPDAYRISPSLADSMAARGFVTVTTTTVTTTSLDPPLDPPALASVQSLQAENVRTLLAAGASVAIGTDGYAVPGIAEAENLVRIGAADDATALRLLVETGPISIYPRRAIGRLVPGYEASFLVLDCDPMADLGCARQIRERVKQGQALTQPATATPLD